MTRQPRTHQIRLALRTVLLIAFAGVTLGSMEQEPAFAQTGTDDTAATARQPHEGSLTGLDVEIKADAYTSARVCGRCHSDIYNSWKNSLHAFSLSDPIFDTSYMEALKAVGEEKARLCLRCHAPAVIGNSDYTLEEGVTAEGVTCDFCHTVTAVQLDSDPPYVTDVGIVKRSVLKKAGSPKHEVAYSELHSKAEFCGGCHNYVSPAGTVIMSTYHEWRDGPYAAEGVQCQHCHMALGDGAVVSKEIGTPRRDMHLHSLIHDTEQLRSAVEVEIVRAVRESGDIAVNVMVKNSGSGHKIPTGMPSRELVLTVTADFGRYQTTRERRYRKTIADESGRILQRDFEAFLFGARIVSDNRIAPREERMERFTFPEPRTRGPVKLTADLSYLYSPRIIDEQQLNINLSRTEQRID